jgi:excreted virulence factor EspC (type VII ESX diderm)
MNPDLEVDTDELRRCAAALAATAADAAAGAARMPVAESSPRWCSADAAALAAEAARQQLALIGGDLAETADQIAEAAEAYELADARAATRLRLTR